MAWRVIRVMWALLLCGPLVHAAGSVRTDGAFVSQAWETDDGLPHNGVNGAVRTADGFLWLATQGGLVRFDGIDFIQNRSPLVFDPRSSRVASIIEENSRVVLIACDTSGLVRMENGRFSFHPLNDSLNTRGRIFSLYREADDVFWVLFADRDLWRWDHGRVSHFPVKDQGFPMASGSIFREPDGSVLVSRGNGLERYRDGVLEPVLTVNDRSIVLTPAKTGGAWAASQDRLLRFDGKELVPVAASVPWSEFPPAMLLEDHEGMLWIGSRTQGLFRWDGSSFRAFRTSHQRIMFLFEDGDQNLWAGTGGGGLNRLQRARFQVLGDRDGWVADIAGSVCEDLEGAIWFGNNSVGLRRVEGGIIQPLPAVKDWPKKAYPIFPDSRGNLWVASGNRLCRIGKDRSVPPTWIPIPPMGTIHVIEETRDGKVWIGGDEPVMVCMNGDQQTLYHAGVGFDIRQVRAIREDGKGNLWIGTEQGDLFRMEGRQFVRYGTESGLSGTTIRALIAEKDGTLWVGTRGGGLAIGKGGKFTSIREENGLPDDVVSQLLDDGHGALWVGGSRVLFKVLKTNLLDFAAGRIDRITPVRYGEDDGLSGFSAAANYQPASWRARDGRLFFVSRKGLVVTDPGTQPVEREGPQVHIEKFLVEGKPVALETAKISSLSKRLEFQFTAPTFASPEKVRFRHRLSGFETDWSEDGTQRQVSYSQLRPGDYRFEVIACSSNLTWGPVSHAVAFRIVPVWWETWWARLAAVIVGAGLLALLVRYWSQQRLKAKVRHLEETRRIDAERARIARDLHDGLGASLTQVGMMAEELAEDCSDMDEMKVYSNRLAGRVRNIARDLDAAVWTVSPKHDSLGALCSYICQYGIEYFRETPVRCRVDMPGDIPEVGISPEARHHLFLIAKEVMNNILKHAEATEVTLTIRERKGRLELGFEDNGHGFSSDGPESEGRHGLQNIRDRVAAVGGELSIRSSSQGTMVQIFLSISSLPR